MSVWQIVWEFLSEYHIITILSFWFNYANVRTTIDFSRYRKSISHSFELNHQLTQAALNAWNPLITGKPASVSTHLARAEEILQHYQHLRSVPWRKHIWRRMTFRNPLDIYPEPLRRFLDWLP